MSQTLSCYFIILDYLNSKHISKGIKNKLKLNINLKVKTRLATKIKPWPKTSFCQRLFIFVRYIDPQQGLIQKEKVDIDGEKSAQISIVAKKTVTQRWLKIMIMESKQATNYNYFVVFVLSCSYYVTDIIKLELCLLVVIILFKIEFGHTQISVPKIGTPMSKTASINPCVVYMNYRCPSKIFEKKPQ